MCKVSLYIGVVIMNPRLIKFAVELQNGERKEDKEHINNKSNGNNGGKKFMNFFTFPVKATVPIKHND